MRTKFTGNIFKLVIFCGLFFIFSTANSQNDSIVKPKSEFWKRVNFGGGIGLSFGNAYSNVSLAPTMYYHVNEKFSIGAGLNGSYVKNNDFYTSWIYGGSVIGIVTPVEFIQLSMELEELRVNTNYKSNIGNIEDNFWNTALFLGAGYRSQNFTIGLRYNVLHKDSNSIYTTALMPFVRVVF